MQKFKEMIIGGLVVFALFGCGLPPSDEPIVIEKPLPLVKENNAENAVSIPVLMYHTFDDEPKFAFINTTGKDFKAQLTALKEDGYTAITNKELHAYQKGEAILPQKSFMITIDDGYESVYKIAFPILKELQMKATFFVITSHIETGERFELPMASWEELKEMSDSGYIEIENHTHDLHWRGNHYSAGYEAMIINQTKDGKVISEGERQQQIVEDVTKAKNLIEKHIGTESIAFAYPYGAYDDIAKVAIAEAGYKITHTIIDGTNYATEGLEYIKRLNISSEISGQQMLEKINNLKPNERLGH